MTRKASIGKIFLAKIVKPMTPIPINTATDLNVAINRSILIYRLIHDHPECMNDSGQVENKAKPDKETTGRVYHLFINFDREV